MSEKLKPATKSATFQNLAEATGLTRKQVATFFDELGKLIQKELGKKGPGIFNLPGMIKIKRVEKPPTKARPGRNPLTGEAMQARIEHILGFDASVVARAKELVKAPS